MSPPISWFVSFSLSRMQFAPLPSLSRMRLGPLSWTLFGHITLYGIYILNLPGISLFVKFSNKLADAV